MRIALLTNNRLPPREGIARHVIEIATRLERRGHEVTVLAQGEPFGRWALHREAGVACRLYPSRPLRPFHQLLSRAPLNRWLAEAERRLDVLHVHLPLLPALNTVARVVVTFHSPMLTDTAAIPEPGLRTLLAKLNARLLSVRQEQAWIDRADDLIAVSRGVARELALHYSLGRRRPVVIENGVDTRAIRPDPSLGRDSRALYVGRLGWRKGLFRLLDALALLPPSIGLDLAGEGPLRPALEQRAARLGIVDRVRFLGFLDRERLLARLSTAGCLVNPADYESGPLTVLEAMAAGCPVVSTRTGIVADLGDSAPVALAEASPGPLAAAIDRTLSGGREVEERTLAARRLVERHFDWETVVDRLEAIYGVPRLAAA